MSDATPTPPADTRQQATEADRIRRTGHCDEHGRVDGMCAWMHEPGYVAEEQQP